MLRRKRGCSSSSSSSSRLQSHRLKRAIMAGRTRGGGGSRCSTPAPSWRMTPSLKSKLDGGGGVSGRTRPVSARKLAATLWEMNEMPSPETTSRRREKTNRPVHTPGSLPLHLSVPSHSPVYERVDRFKNVSHRPISVSRKSWLEDENGEVFDSLSNDGLNEIGPRSRARSPTGSKARLEDVNNTLTTSKELLKIIHRVWAHNNLPSSTISALHSGLERARLQVKGLIKDWPVDRPDVSRLIRRFAEERASWKQAIRPAVVSAARELEVERSLNKRLVQELAETKALLEHTLKELECEKRAREIMEQVFDGLVVDERDEARYFRATTQVHEEPERERAQMKLADTKCESEAENALVDQLKSQLEVYLGHKVSEIDVKDDDDYDLHSIELNMDNNNRSFKWAHNKDSIEDEVKVKVK